MSKEKALKKPVISYSQTIQNSFPASVLLLLLDLQKSTLSSLTNDIQLMFALFFRTLHTLSTCLWNYNVPLLVCISYGFIGSIRLQINEHCVIESHPDNTFEDLRLDRPFPGLIKFMENVHLGEMDHKQFSHTPYLVLLYKALELWKQRNPGLEFPSSYKEKNELRKIIENGDSFNLFNRKILLLTFSADLSHGIVKDDETNGDEDNVREAVKAVNTALHKTKVPSNVFNIINDEQCTQLKEKNSFWIMTRALKEFIEKEGDSALPLRGTLPDMTSDSQRYIALQNV